VARPSTVLGQSDRIYPKALCEERNNAIQSAFCDDINFLFREILANSLCFFSISKCGNAHNEPRAATELVRSQDCVCPVAEMGHRTACVQWLKWVTGLRVSSG
jgi:hypothetical protein